MRLRAFALANLALPLVTACFLTLAPPADAQEFGQWSWDASLGAIQRDYENRLGPTKASAFDERSLGLSLGVNGFVVHPAVARFRLGLDGQVSRFKGGRALDSRRWGGRGDVSLFPVGRYRVSLFAARQLYDYKGITQEDPLTLLGIPDTSTTWGGRLRVTAGPLRGTLAGFQASRLGFLATDLHPETQDQEFVDWSRTGRRFQPHVRVERRSHDFGAVGFATDDLTANVDQHGNLTPTWRWDMFGVALRRKLRIEDGASSTFDDLRTTQRFVKTRQDGLVDLSYTGGLTSGSGSSFQSHALLGRYRRRLGPRWELAPFVGFGLQLSGSTTLRSPQAGVSATWLRQGGTLDTTLSSGASYALVRRSGGASSGTDSLLVLTMDASMSHGDEATLREELEGSWSRNQLRFAGEALAELPDLGARLVGTGTEDVLRGRLTLRRRWHSIALAGYGEWSRREPAAAAHAGDLTIDTSTASLQVTAPRFGLLGNLGDARVRGATPQRLLYRSASLSLRPWRLLSLAASYRTDTRRLELAPDVDGERAEAGIDLGIGAFVLQVHGFVSKERRPAFPEHTNRGLVLTLSRRFFGWLPLVTGPPRGGTIS